MLPSLILSLHAAVTYLPIAALVAAFAVGAHLLARRGAGPRRAWGFTITLLAVLSLGARDRLATGARTGEGPASTDAGASEAAVPDTSVPVAASGRELEHVTDRAHPVRRRGRGRPRSTTRARPRSGSRGPATASR